MTVSDNDDRSKSFDMTDEELERRRRIERRRRREEQKKRRRRQVMIYRCIFAAVCVAVAIGLFFTVRAGVRAVGSLFAKDDSGVMTDENAGNTSDSVSNDDPNTDSNVTEQDALNDANDQAEETAETAETEDEAADTFIPSYAKNDSTKAMTSAEVTAEYGIVVNADEQTVVAHKGGYDRINPASMTKLLTLLVAAELVPEEKRSEIVSVPTEATDYAFTHDCSNVGFAKEERVTVNDLFYGTILPSGGDAAIALAIYTCGSHEAFVGKMNEKLQELGIADTAHFTNCVGIYDANHYCTAYDMAVIMGACIQDPYCREILKARTYTTTKTAEHPEGLLISNWFMRRIEDKDCGGEVLGAKTGYVDESGSCAASYYMGADGKEYICVTAKSHSSWRCIYDHVAVYNIYIAGNTAYVKR